uniref:Galectin 3 binding protein n=1 Tax=Myotis myotis TaxID=51298 RepID=A0A7J7T6C9_MYOMY|nr:galectin 3 binding protein [Myotis myotis]
MALPRLLWVWLLVAGTQGVRDGDMRLANGDAPNEGLLLPLPRRLLQQLPGGHPPLLPDQLLGGGLAGGCRPPGAHPPPPPEAPPSPRGEHSPAPSPPQQPPPASHTGLQMSPCSH